MAEVQPIGQPDETPANPIATTIAAVLAKKTRPALRPPLKAPKKQPEQRSALQKILPTDRIHFSKQLDIIRAYAAHGANGKPVTNADVGEEMKMQPSTVSLTNAFLSSVGLIFKAEGGYLPAPEVVSFLRANEWTTETAAHELAPKIRQSWFAETLLPKVAFAAMTEEAALAKLSDAAQAGPKYRRQLCVLLDYLQASGLIDREGGQIMLAKNGPVVVPSRQDSSSSQTPAIPDPSPRGAAATVFSRTTEGAVHFNVSFRVDMKELEGWKSDRIAAFFNGIAQVLAAKADVERQSV